ncbi:MAG: hypothetical protein HY308_12000 [Gammaproteobacteria bacterium]|nr:hypothetical protein [Gammaproteobacteria bacterium]
MTRAVGSPKTPRTVEISGTLPLKNAVNTFSSSLNVIGGKQMRVVALILNAVFLCLTLLLAMQRVVWPLLADGTLWLWLSGGPSAELAQSMFWLDIQSLNFLSWLFLLLPLVYLLVLVYLARRRWSRLPYVGSYVLLVVAVFLTATEVVMMATGSRTGGDVAMLAGALVMAATTWVSGRLLKAFKPTPAVA